MQGKKNFPSVRTQISIIEKPSNNWARDNKKVFHIPFQIFQQPKKHLDIQNLPSLYLTFSANEQNKISQKPKENT